MGKQAPLALKRIDPNQKSDQTQELVVTPGASLEAITRAQIDTSIATANKYPRDIRKFLDTAKELVTIDEDTARECIYALPRGGGGKDDSEGTSRSRSDGKIEGPSVRLAEIAASQYRNLEIGGRIIDDDGKFIVAQGVAHDMENNVRYVVEVRRRVTNRSGSRYSDDMVAITMNAAVAIAQRNATFKIIPKAYINQLYEAARAKITGESKNNTKAERAQFLDRCVKAVKYFEDKGVPHKTILDHLKHTAVEQMTPDDIVTLTGYLTAIRENHTSVEKIFGVTTLNVQEAVIEEVKAAEGPELPFR